MAWKRRDMTAIKGFPKVNKPLRKGERTIKQELEKNTIVVMPDVRNPPRRGVEGDRGKEGGKRESTEAILSKREGGKE